MRSARLRGLSSLRCFASELTPRAPSRWSNYCFGTHTRGPIKQRVYRNGVVPEPPVVARLLTGSETFYRGSRFYKSAVAAAKSGCFLLALRQAGDTGGDASCEAAAVPSESLEDASTMGTSAPDAELRQVALAHLTRTMLSDESARAGVASGRHGQGSRVPPILMEAGAGSDLPANIFDLRRVLERTPLSKDENAFHNTMNSNDTIRCPFVLNKPTADLGAIEAVVRFGKSTVGHPETVHGGVAALTFDNLLAMCLFMQGTGPVFTAYLKVDYKAPLPILTTAKVDVSVDRVEGRKLFVTGRLKSMDGKVLYSSAEALFITPGDSRGSAE